MQTFTVKPVSYTHLDVYKRQEQVKGRIKNVAKENKADARTLMRIDMME